MTTTIDDFDEIRTLATELNAHYARIAAHDPTPTPVEAYLQEPAAQFVASAVLSGRTVPTNPSTVVALRLAVWSLKQVPVPH